MRTVPIPRSWWAGWTGPSSTRQTVVAAVACLLGLVAVFVADLKIPGQVTVSALGVFPIAAAAWLLSERQTALVLLVAFTAQAVLGIEGAVSWLSAGAAICTFAAVAVLVRFAAQGFAAVARNHELERRLLEEAANARGRRERERISRDLHDGAVQALFAIGMGLQAVARSTDDDLVRIRLRNEARALDGVIDDLRSYVFGLVPGILKERNLSAALSHLGETFQGSTGVACQVSIDAPVAADLEYCAGPVVQIANEALSNVARHAQASVVRLELCASASGALLEVSDDGCGFDLGAVGARGHGLRNFADRAEGLGGRLRIDSAPGHGTVLRITLPRAAAMPVATAAAS
jgi:signal transduction histidine kinase